MYPIFYIYEDRSVVTQADSGGSVSMALSQRLVLSVVEQLKWPLTNIARQAELAELMPGQIDAGSIRVTADAALRLLDSYLLGVRLAGQSELAFEVEPVSVAAVLYDAARQLEPLAKVYGVELDLRVDGRHGPVLAHRRGLEAALVALGYALIEALPAQEASQLKLCLSAHRCRYGITAGLYSDTPQALTNRALRLGRELYGQARQPLAALSHTGAAGVFVADTILQAMHVRLMSSRHRRLYGLGMVLPLSAQLRLAGL